MLTDESERASHGRTVRSLISYASEDRNAVAYPLQEALQREGLKVWLDQGQLRLGESVAGRIRQGLRDSLFTVAILSPDYLRKEWPKRELEASLDKVLPVLHNVTHERVRAEAPLIAALKSVSLEKDGQTSVVAAILDRVRSQQPKPRSDIAVDLAHGQAGRQGWDDLETAIDRVYPNTNKLVRGFFEEQTVLAASRVLILPPPRKYRFSRAEIDKIESWVAAGGGLLLMGHYAERHHEMNISEVAWRFDFEFVDDVVLPASRADRAHARTTDAAYIVPATPSVSTHPLAAGVQKAAFISSASVRSTVIGSIEFTLDTPADTVIARPLGKIDADGGENSLMM